MKSLLPLIALAALAACNQKEPEVLDSRAPDPNAAALANAAPVELPPAIRAQKTYRCENNDLFYLTWFVGDKIMDARDDEKGAPVRLTSESGSAPWTSADGWSVSGELENVTVTAPGKAKRVCHT